MNSKYLMSIGLFFSISFFGSLKYYQYEQNHLNERTRYGLWMDYFEKNSRMMNDCEKRIRYVNFIINLREPLQGNDPFNSNLLKAFLDQPMTDQSYKEIKHAAGDLNDIVLRECYGLTTIK